MAVEVRAEKPTTKFQFSELRKNRNYWILTGFFTVLVLAQQIGFSLLPNFLEDVGSFSKAQIGVLFSVSFLGAFMGNILVARVQPRTGFIILLIASWVGMLLMFAPMQPFLAAIAFFFFGSLTTMWLIRAACSGRAVSAANQVGLAVAASGLVLVAVWQGVPAPSIALILVLVGLVAACQPCTTFLEVITSLGSQPGTKVLRGREDRAPTATFGTAAQEQHTSA